MMRAILAPNILVLLALIAVELAGGFAWGRSDNYRNHERWGLLLVLGVLLLPIRKRFGTLAALTWAWVCGLAAWIIPHSFLGRAGAEAFLGVIAVSLPILLLELQMIINAGQVLALFSAVMMLLGHQGAMSNPSMDASFLACVLPSFLTPLNGRIDKSGLICSAILISAVVRAGSSFGYVATAAVMALWSVRSGYWLPPLIAAGAGGYYLDMHPDKLSLLLNPSGRFQVWAQAIDYFQAMANPITGFGPGSTGEILPRLQLQAGKTHSIFGWMHSDWIATLFETGWVGLSLITATYGVALWKARGYPALFSSLVALGIVSFGQMPSQYYFFSLYGVCLVSWALELTDDKEQT